MREISEQTLELLDQLVDRTTGRWRLPADESVALLQQIGQAGTTGAIPYLLPFLQHREARLSFSAVAPAASSALIALLGRTRPGDLPWLDERVRGFWRWDSACRWLDLNDFEALPIEESHRVSLLGLASFHADGHIREAAVRRLCTFREGTELPFLLLRLNDWVGAVRGLALAAVMLRIESGDAGAFIHCLPLLRRLREYHRVDHGAVVVGVERLLLLPASRTALLSGLDHTEREVRRETFRLLCRRDDVQLGEIAPRVLRDDDLVVRLAAAREVPVLSGAELDRALSLMRSDRHMAVRGLALEIYAEHYPEEAGPVLREALLDTSPAVRHTARFFLERMESSVDFVAVYREALGSSESPVLKAAVGGIGETGSTRDAALLAPFTHHENSKVSRTALKALDRLDREGWRDLFFEALEDRRPGVHGTARHLLGRCLWPRDIPRLRRIALQSQSARARLGALRLLDSIRPWASLPLMLRACVSDLPVERAVSLDLLERWLHRHQFAIYAPPPPDPPALLAAESAFHQVSADLPPSVTRQLLAVFREPGL